MGGGADTDVVGMELLPVGMVASVYSAVGLGTVADLLQQHGQREMSVSESNVILCMELVFAAICTYAFLREILLTREIDRGGIDCDGNNIGFQMKVSDSRLGIPIFGSDFWDAHWRRNSDSVYDSKNSGRIFF